MGWDNPPLPWRELARRLSWGTAGSEPEAPPEALAPALPPVTRLPVPAQDGTGSPDAPAWAELHCHSSYSFLDGASSPEGLVAEAARRGALPGQH